MSEDSEEEQIRRLLGSDFDIKAFKSSREAVQEFRTVLDKRRVNPKAQRHWRQAWQQFENVSEQYIEKIPAIPFKNKDPLALKKFHAAYKRRAVTNFLPYFESRLPFLTGRAKRSAEGSLRLLKCWRSELSVPKSYEVKEEIVFEEAIPAEPLFLEGPDVPSHSHDGEPQVQQGSGAEQISSVTSVPSTARSEFSYCSHFASGDSFDNLESDSEFNEWEHSSNLCLARDEEN